MDLSSYRFERLRDDPEFVLYRGQGLPPAAPVLLLTPSKHSLQRSSAGRLEREFELAEELHNAWALQPVGLTRHDGQAGLVFEDPGGHSLDRIVGSPMELGEFLSIAIGLCAALREVHARGLIHKDIKPSNVFVDGGGQVRLTGFGVASRLPRERQPEVAPEVIVGSLPYMAPEQTGRMNRVIDSRSDLYALGVTLYEMLVGALPFEAHSALDWIHCHVARIPPPPSIRVDGVPPTLEAIILKLLSKNAEDRYQTAFGVEHDLKAFRAAWRTDRSVGLIALGDQDRSSQLIAPQKLYGREAERKALRAAFERVAEHGKFEAILVSGVSGIGKTSLICELHPSVHSARGMFALGKFDQQKREIPYASIAAAFRDLLRQILRLDEAELAIWRTELENAVGQNSQLLADLLPELGLILEKRDAPPTLSAKEENARFRLTIRRFISVFAKPRQPLVFVLDDMQWLDTASLALLKHLAATDEIPNLLLICGYRTDSPEAAPRLLTVLRRIRALRPDLKEIRLANLHPADVVACISDVLQERSEAVAPLADVIFQKTHGNPFFVSQFLTTLSAEGFLSFDASAGAWRWDQEAIWAKSITANVVDLMSEKLARYNAGQLSILTRFACLGHTATTHDLACVLDVTGAEVDAALQPFVEEDLIHRLEHGYSFAHDGVRDAAYALLDPGEKAAAHLSIGQALTEGLGRKALEDGAFEIANQLNRAECLVTGSVERLWLAELNLAAGKRARAATAYEAASRYFEAGHALLEPDWWSSQYRTCFEMALQHADCQFALGRFEEAETAFARLSELSRDLSDRAQVVSRQMILFAYVGRAQQAIELASDCLEQMGIDLPRTPTTSHVAEEYLAFERRMAGRDIDELLDLPLMKDDLWLEIMSLLEELLGPLGGHNANFLDLIVLRMINISLDHGCTHETPHALANFGSRLFGWRFGSFHDGHRVCRVAIQLIEDKGLNRYGSRVYAIVSGCVSPWNQPLQESYEIACRAIAMPRERGGIGYSGYAWVCGLTALLDGGRALAELERLIEQGLANARESKFALVIEFITAQQELVGALRGNRGDGATQLSGFSNPEYEAYLEGAPGLLHAMTRYYVRKLQFLVYAGRDSEGLAILEKLGGNLGQSPILCDSPVFEVVEYCFYSALARAAHLSITPVEAWGRDFEALKISAAQLAEWAGRCPDNIADRSLLVAAEVARLDGRALDAEQLYEQAILGARDRGFIQVEGLANERAARFHAARGLNTISLTYQRNARECFDCWGADAKVRQLDALHPHAVARSDSLGTGVGRLHQFDVQALLTMHRAVSQEIQLDRVIERLMVAAVEYAGAVRGLLLLERGDEMRLVAEAVSRADAVTLVQRTLGPVALELPNSILNFVTRTQQPVILDDAQEPNPYSDDVYLKDAKPRSLLCLPLLKQQQLVGALYLENSLTTHMFTPERLTVLQLLASQSAISIENAQLFLDLESARDKARQASEELLGAFDLMPAMAWRTDALGFFEFANKQWHDYTGVAPADLKKSSHPYHPDDVDKVTERWSHLKAFRTSGEFEARLRRYDGEYRTFLIRATPLRDEAGAVVKWHGTNTDIENLKRAEQAQEALAQVSRLTAIGELSVSIAHEVNQPLMAIVTNAATCARWLTGDVVNIEEARLAAERVIRDGHRAGDVIASIRALARKAPTGFAELDVNDVIAEALTLARNELDRYGIVVETRLAAEAGSALGDRVQIQQVVLNLLMNGIEAMTVSPTTTRLLLVRTEQVGGGFVQVSVSDTGPGVDAEHTARIFDAFFTTKAGGVGMGLSICRSIIESHGGRISVAPNPDGGCNFTFQIPSFAEEHAHARLI